jgi:DsbC/DsbD-like thiol-disulfide interchange protein
MHKYLILLFFIPFGFGARAQIQHPLKWAYSAKKIADKTYEIHLTATLQDGWHTYSQSTPDGGPVATKISFKKNPLMIMDSSVKEEGKLLQKHEEVFGVDVKYFSNKVDFVQVLKLKSNVRTSVNGTIEFMVCNDIQCLPPATVPFAVTIN